MPFMKLSDPPDACFELVIDAGWPKPDAPDGNFIPTRVKMEERAKYSKEWRRCVRCVRRTSTDPILRPGFLPSWQTSPKGIDRFSHPPGRTFSEGEDKRPSHHHPSCTPHHPVVLSPL